MVKPEANLKPSLGCVEVDLLASYFSRRRILRELFRAGRVSLSAGETVTPIPGAVRIFVNLEMSEVESLLKQRGVEVRRVRN